MDYFVNHLDTFLDLERGSYLAVYGRVREPSDFIKDILNCVPKVKKGFTSLEQHEVPACCLSVGEGSSILPDNLHSLMEPVEGELQGLNIGSSNLLALPEPCQLDSDDELLGIGGIKPKYSPIPRRRSSLSCSDDDSEPLPSSSRRVSFADAFGLSLVSVKQFDTRSLCAPTDPLEVDLKNAKEYFLKLLFVLPVTLEELLCRVQEQKVDLESLELLPGTTTLKGTVRVLNMGFDKLVYIRTSLDCWSSHFDLLAEYMSGSSQGFTDCFSFKLTLVPPFGQLGARVDFCIRYETTIGTFWANNSGQNFVLFCHEKAKEQDENENLVPKSCLKPGRHSSMTSTASNAEEIPEIILNCGITAVTEPVGIVGKEEKTQEGQRKLKEESIRNCSRRSRRKAARMAKLQQYFAQKDETDLQQTENDTDDVDVSVPAIDEASLNLSTQQTNAISLLAEPVKKDRQESVVASTDVERNQSSASHTQKQENGSIPVIQPELITSKSQTRRPALDSVNNHKSGVDSLLLENSQDKDTVTSQTVILSYQTADKSIGKTVEKAWECFEKCAMEKIGSATDINCSGDEEKHVQNTLLESNQASQPSAHHYTFETIVAPLYHQVFERMENDRRKFKNSTSKADESAGKRDDGRLRVVTYTGSNPEISAKHGNDDECHETSKETFRQYLHNTKSATENTLSVPKGHTERAEDIDFQDDALSDITVNLLDANILESNAAPAVIDSEKQHSSDRQPSFLEDVSTIDQTEKTPEIIPLQSNQSNDAEYSLHTLQQEQTSTDSSILPVQCELDLTAAKPLPAIVSENISKNAQSEDKSVIQKSFKTQISTEVNKAQDKGAQTSERALNTCIKCPDESYTPLPDSTLFQSDILSNVTPKGESQNLTQATIQPQIPATGATVPYHQDDTSLIQETAKTCQNGESSHHVGSEMESISSDGNEDVDSWENMENDNETIQTEVVKMSPEETDVDVSQIDNNKEHQIFLLNIPDKVTVFGELLVQDTVVSNMGSNPDNPENASQENIEEDVEEIVHVKDPGKTEEQELTNCRSENQSDEVEELQEVEKQLKEKEEKEQENRVEQENDEKLELGSGKSKEGSYVTEDDEEKLKKDAEGKDGAPKRNVVDWKNKKDLEAEFQEQVTVDGAMSVATLQSISNEDSFIKEVHQHIGQEQLNTCLEQMSEEPESKGQTVGGVEEILCETGSSEQALDVNIDVAFRHCAKEEESSSKFVNKEENVCCQVDKDHVAEDANGEVDALLEKQESDCLNEQSENIDDSASTESLTDDEMEVYLLRLKNTQQTGLKDVISMEKRHSISRSWTISSPMPSISEHTDEDQPNALLDDLIHVQRIKPERDSLALSDEAEEVIGLNVLWWREFFSSENMAKIMVYTLLFVVFLITSYICDFIACFGLYLIALYWLYFQVQREPLKGT